MTKRAPLSQFWIFLEKMRLLLGVDRQYWSRKRAGDSPRPNRAVGEISELRLALIPQKMLSYQVRCCSSIKRLLGLLFLSKNPVLYSKITLNTFLTEEKK